MTDRRSFLKHLGIGALGLSVLPAISCTGQTGESNNESTDESTAGGASNGLFFKISLAQWSLHRTLFEGKLDNLDFAKTAAETFDIHAVEYVNQFFKDKAQDTAYLTEMNKRASDYGVTNVLLMIDGEGQLGSTVEQDRLKAVENHYRWVEAAKFLGCHSIRVNAAGEGTPEEVQAAAIDGLGRLAEFASQHDIGVIVENHGGMSSHGDWLSAVLRGVGKDNCGSLPDFGNFYEYDRYQGVKDLMPLAKGVSAKTYAFDAQGDETKIDYRQMLQIVKDAGYTGHIGVEYEGDELSEEEGIKATKALLERIGAELS